MLPKAVYWDMDGTLVDSEPLHSRALVAALESVGIAPPPDLHDRVIGQSAVPVYRMMVAEFGLSLPFDRWIRRKYAFYLEHARTLRGRAGALEIFRALQDAGVVQAIVSNSDRIIVDANLRAVGIGEPGMKTVSRNDVRDGKPHAEPYLRAAYLTGVAVRDSVVMEDSVTGAAAGLAAGMRTVFWPQDPLEAPAGALHAADPGEVRRLLGLG